MKFMSELFNLNLIANVYNNTGKNIKRIYDNKNHIIWEGVIGPEYDDFRITPGKKTISEEEQTIICDDFTVCKTGGDTVYINRKNYSGTIDTNGLYKIKFTINNVIYYLAVVDDVPNLVRVADLGLDNSRLYWIIEDNKLKSYYNNKYIAFGKYKNYYSSGHAAGYELNYETIYRTEITDVTYKYPYRYIGLGEFLYMDDKGVDIFIGNTSLALATDHATTNYKGTATFNLASGYEWYTSDSYGTHYYFEDKHLPISFCKSYGKLYIYGPTLSDTGNRNVKPSMSKIYDNVISNGTSFNLEINKQ